MNPHRFVFTTEHCLYLACFALALALRLHHLGAHPLTDAEARAALPAYRLLRGGVEADPAAAERRSRSTPSGDSPAYFSFAYLSFLLFDASDATARLAPALFGSALVFLPLFFGDQLGRGGALFAAGLLAVSSGLMAASRSADGAVIALFGLGFGLGALRRYLAATRHGDAATRHGDAATRHGDAAATWQGDAATRHGDAAATWQGDAATRHGGAAATRQGDAATRHGGAAATRQGDAAATWLVASGVFFGLGLASGAPFLTGALVVALTAFAAAWISPDERAAIREAWACLRRQARTFLVALGLTALIVSTAASMDRLGLGALGASWVGWLRGWAALPQAWPLPQAWAALPQAWPAAGRSPGTVFTFLLVYEPLLVVFGVIGAARAFLNGHRLAQRLAWFSLAALGFATLYSGRTLFDVIWVVLPLAALAGWSLAEIIGNAWEREEWPLVAAQVGVIAALFIFSGLNLAALAEQARVSPDFSQGSLSLSGFSIPVSRLSYLYLAVVALGLVFVVSYLFGMGWSPRAARLGLTLGCSAALLFMNLAAGWGVTRLRANDPAELWWERPTADGLRHLMLVLRNTSNYATGHEHDIQVTVQAPPDGALAWALRAFAHAAFVETLGANVDSPVVITPIDESQPPEAHGEAGPQLGSSYVGQSFPLRYALRAAPAPNPSAWADQLGWFMFRRAPAGSAQAERVILWVRQDVQQLQTATGR